MLEESAASIAHFSWLMAYAATTLLMIAPLFNQAFLGTTLSSTLVYIWSRRNPDVRLSFLGLLTFKAPWLPWVLIAFNVVLHGHWPKDELCGIVVGHSKQTTRNLMSRAMLTDIQSGTSSTTFTHPHTTAIGRWIRRNGGSGCSNEARYLRPTRTSSTQQRLIETSRSPPYLTCGSRGCGHEMQRSLLPSSVHRSNTGDLLPRCIEETHAPCQTIRSTQHAGCRRSPIVAPCLTCLICACSASMFHIHLRPRRRRDVIG